MRRFMLSLAAVAALCVAAQPAQAFQAPEAPAAATAPTEQIRTAELLADFYAPPAGVEASPGAVIVLGGSEGGLAGPIARGLAREGIPALTISYFAEAGQSPKLDQIPIEQVTRGLDWLAQRQSGPIAILGGSKGAELALVVASREPSIRGVVAAVPSNVVWQGIDMTGGATGSSWTANGQPLPYVAYDMSQGFRGVFALYADSLAGASPESMIPVERIAGPVLLISDDADGLWPSTDMGRRIEARLAEHDFAHPVEHLVYSGAGHAVFGTPLTGPLSPQMTGMLGFLGGSEEPLRAARADVWPKTVAFLKSVLAQP